MSVKDSNLSASDRFLARRRTVFLRDWILALVALGLALAGGVFHSERGAPPPAGPHAAAPFAPQGD
jgi:hypothetical protein